VPFAAAMMRDVHLGSAAKGERATRLALHCPPAVVDSERFPL